MKWLDGVDRLFAFIVDGKNQPSKFSASKNMPFMIISYEMLVKNFESISQLAFEILICDEGHRLKNSQIKLTTLLSQINCKRRLLLTGTPVQNNLQEFYSLISFVQPNLFANYHEYRSRFEIPILASQQPDSLPLTKEIGEELGKELNLITSKFILRRRQELNCDFLKQKQEIILFCRPSTLQMFLFEKISELYDYEPNPSPLQFIMLMKNICNRGIVNLDYTSDIAKRLLEQIPQSIIRSYSSDSGKITIVRTLLKSAVLKNREKVVLVSYSTKTLDLLQSMCQDLNLRTCRLDGGVSSLDRRKIVDKFNSPDSLLNVFLLSGKAGGTGLNLIGASRLVLFDNDWNPANDLQAMSRIWRDGQTRNCYIYRLITTGSIEEKIFQRQLSKTLLTSSVVLDAQDGINFHFTKEELKDLFSPPPDYDQCATHTMMNCSCLGNGTIPENNNEQLLDSEEDDDEELSVFHRAVKRKRRENKKKVLNMDGQYEHHSSPDFAEETLQVR